MSFLGSGPFSAGGVQNISFAAASSSFNVVNTDTINITLTGNLIIPKPTGLTTPRYLTFIISQDILGSHSLSIAGVSLGSGAIYTKLVAQFFWDGTDLLFVPALPYTAWLSTVASLAFVPWDSNSAFPNSTLSIDTTTTTDTLNVSDGTASGQVFISPPASGTYVKTIHKTGTADAKVFSKSRLGYVRLDNTTSQGIKIGNASIALSQRSIVGVLCRLDAAQLTSYTGDFNILKTSQTGASGNPYIIIGVGGATSGSNATLTRKYFFCNREGFNTSYANASIYEKSDMNNLYGNNLDAFGVSGAALLSNKWVWVWMMGSDISDTPFASFNYSDDGSGTRQTGTTRLAHAVHGCFPSDKGISSRWAWIPTFNTQCQFTGQMSGTNTLTVSAMIAGTIITGASPTGAGVASGRLITAQLTGTPGGVGTYTVNGAVQTFGPVTVSCMGIYPEKFDGSDGAHPLIDFVLGSGSTGTGKVVDIARVIKINTFPCGYSYDPTLNIGYDVIARLSNGIHPASIGGLMTGSDFCLDFGSLPANCTAINTPVFNPAEDGPIAQRYHGLDTTDVTLSVTNQRIA